MEALSMATMTKMIAALMVVAGCGGSAPQGQQAGGETVVVAHETRSSGSAAATDKDEHTCEHKHKDPALHQAGMLLEQKKFAEAVAELEAVTGKQPDNGKAWHLYGFALHAAGQLDQALVIHEKAASFPEQKAIASYNMACVHALKGRADQAFAALDQAIAAGFAGAEHMEKDADLASLKGDPRFATALQAARANPQREKSNEHSCEH
jgi:Flp pilus assembly protein TadD